MNLPDFASRLNKDNFRTCYFQRGGQRAFVSEEFAPGSENEVLCSFNVTLRSDEWGDMEQRSYQELAEALEQLISQYGTWEFVDMSSPTKSGGCSSCVAH